MPVQKILLVDDEEDLLKGMTIRLVSWGYDVVTAATGEEALDILKKDKKSIRIVILDIMMPGMDGIETLKKIRSFNKDIPVFMLTAYANEERIEKTRELGISGFVPKGAAFLSPSDAIRTLLRGIKKER